MIRIALENTDNVISTVNKIKELKDLNIELVIPQESPLFDNSLNLKLIQHEADRLEKSVVFITEDEIGNNLITSLSGEKPDAFTQTELQNFSTETSPKRQFKFPKIGFPKINFKGIKLPNLRALGAKKGLIFAAIGVLIFVGSFIFYGLNAPVVSASITVKAQPLTRSVTVTVKSTSATDVKAKILKGSQLSTTVDNTIEQSTTGTKLIGEKAEGRVTLYNYTSSDVKVSKSTKLTYEGKSTDLVYYLKDDVTVPAGSTPDPGNPLVPGEVSEDVTASDIGETYNISDSKTLVVKGYSKDDVVGKTKTDITGGKSETVKIVAAADKTNLSSSALASSTSKAEASIKSKLAQNQKLITGSIESKITKETFNKNVGDQSDKLSLTQSITATALIYFDSDLNKFLDDYVKDLIPQGFVLSSQNRTVSVEPLGKTLTTALSSSAADVQVTLKTFVVPDIKEEDVKKQLVGKSPEEAEKILSSIKNISTYEFKLSPAIPFFRRVPSDLNRIHLTIQKE